MTTAGIVDDIIRTVDANPMALEALRSRLLTRELLESPARLAQLAESHTRLAESHVHLAESHARFEATTREFMATTREFMASTREFIKTFQEFMATTQEFMATTQRFMTTTQQFIETTQRFIEVTNERLDNLERLVGSIHHDMGVFKGHYARDMAENMAFSIAYDHGFVLKRVLARSEIWAMLQASDTSGIDGSDLKSFSLADLIMLATDADGADCYIAVEASYTVHWRDVERAVRNAEYIARFTQRPAHPLVAGVEVNERVRNFAIKTGKALWSQMPDRLLQAD